MRGGRIACAPGEGMAMRIAGWSFGSPAAGLLLLPAIAVAGCATWMMLPEPSDAESGAAATVRHRRRRKLSLQRSAAPDPGCPGEPAPSARRPRRRAPPETVRPQVAARRSEDFLAVVAKGRARLQGAGDVTLRNANDYAVKDIEIACAFTRRDGSHLTDRKRVIPDTVNTKSRKVYRGMLVGFVNVNANKAKCSLVTASRT